MTGKNKKKNKDYRISKMSFYGLVAVLIMIVFVLTFMFSAMYSTKLNPSTNGDNSDSDNHVTTVVIPRCGDGNCDSGESCSTCPTDCGVCKPKYNAYIANGIVHWEFSDMKNNPVNWQVSIDSYKVAVSMSRNKQTLYLNCSTCLKNPVSIADYRPFVLSHWFDKIITTLTYGRTDREFVSEVVNLKSQLIIYSNLTDEYAQWPVQTLTEGRGSCRDTAVLMASLLESGNQQANYGMKIEFIYLDPDHLDRPENITHILLRITYRDGDTRFLETTINNNVDVYSNQTMHYWAFSVIVSMCSDLTVYGGCSGINIGFYCDNGNLIPTCSRCGCPTDYPYCGKDDRCFR